MTKVQQGICGAVSTHTGIKKDTVTKAVTDYLHDAGGENPIVNIELDRCGFSLKIGESKNTIGLGKMMFFKYLEKTELFSEANNMLTNEASAVAFYSGGALMVIRIAHEYNGIGGIFVKRNPESLVGYIIEPIRHYLIDNHPVNIEE